MNLGWEERGGTKIRSLTIRKGPGQDLSQTTCPVPSSGPEMYQSDGEGLGFRGFRGGPAGDKDRERAQGRQQPQERKKGRRELPREGQGARQSGGSWSGQGEGLISRRPSWPAAPDRELGKGQPPRGRG